MIKTFFRSNAKFIIIEWQQQKKKNYGGYTIGPMPANVIAMPEALFNFFLKNEFNANENDELLKPYPIAIQER